MNLICITEIINWFVDSWNYFRITKKLLTHWITFLNLKKNSLIHLFMKIFLQYKKKYHFTSWWFSWYSTKRASFHWIILIKFASHKNSIFLLHYRMFVIDHLAFPINTVNWQTVKIIGQFVQSGCMSPFLSTQSRHQLIVTQQ